MYVMAQLLEHRLIEQWMPFAICRAVGYYKHGRGRRIGTLDDCKQVAFMGLIHAAAKFEPARIRPETGRPYSFGTYADWWIRQRLQYAAEEGGVIRIPHDLRAMRPGELVGPDGKTDRVRYADNLRVESLSDDFSGHEKPAKEPPEPNIEPELTALVQDCLRALPANYRRVIEGRFGVGFKIEVTLRELADEFGVSKTRIDQIERKALRFLKREIRNRCPLSLLVPLVCRDGRRRMRSRKVPT